MAMNLETMQKQRIKAYKDYLRQQIQKNAKIRKQQNNYQRRKQQANINELISRLDEDDVRRLEERRNMAVLLKEHNSGLSQLKKSIHQEEPVPPNLPNNSFLDRINKDDIQRIHKNKQTFVNFTHDNNVQEHTKQAISERVREFDRQQEERHVKRVKEMQLISQKNYEEIKRKHEQNMKLYDMHSSLINENDQYRKMAEKFTECEDDIISRLKRNESAQRKRVYKNNQQILKHQMGQYNERRSLQRSQILEGQDIDQSIFKKLLHGSPNYKKQYGEQLRYQMSEMESRKNEEKHTMKQKYKIPGIFGGEHGREREAQIQYIDRKMGLGKMNKSLSLNNEEQYNKEGSEQKQQYSRRSSQLELIAQKPDTLVPKIGKNMKREAVLNLPIPNEKGTTIQSYRTPRNSSEDMQTFNEVKNSPTKAQLSVLLPDRNQDKKLFRSFDVVTGKNKFYG